MANPVATIAQPDGNTVIHSSQAVTLIGSATDAEDGVLLGPDLEWSSSIDGVLGTGLRLSTSGLTAGAHVITLTATDSNTNTGTATARLIVGGDTLCGVNRYKTWLGTRYSRWKREDFAASGCP